MRTDTDSSGSAGPSPSLESRAAQSGSTSTPTSCRPSRSWRIGAALRRLWPKTRKRFQGSPASSDSRPLRPPANSRQYSRRRRRLRQHYRVKASVLSQLLGRPGSGRTLLPAIAHGRAVRAVITTLTGTRVVTSSPVEVS